METRKEKIIDLARKTFPLYHNKLPEYEQKFKDFADAILALPIDKEKLREELIKFAGFITDEYLKTKG